MIKIIFVLSIAILTFDDGLSANVPAVEASAVTNSVANSDLPAEKDISRVIPMLPGFKALFAQMLAPNPELLTKLITDTLNEITSKLDVIPLAGNEAVQQFAPFNAVNDPKLKKSFNKLNTALSTYLSNLQAALAKIIPDANIAKDGAIIEILETGRNASTLIDSMVAGHIGPVWSQVKNSADQKIFNCEVRLAKNPMKGLIKVENSNLACAEIISEKYDQMHTVVPKIVNIALIDLKLVTEAIPLCLKAVGAINVVQIDALTADKVATLDTCLNAIETGKPLSISVGSETLITLFDASIGASKTCITDAIKLLVETMIPGIKTFIDCLAN